MLHAITRLGTDRVYTNPLTLISIYKKVILPSVLYGCEMWTNMTKRDVQKLETFQHYAVKLILNLQTSTRSDMCESLVGLYRIIAVIDKRKLNFLQCLINCKATSIPKQIFIRRPLVWNSR